MPVHVYLYTDAAEETLTRMQIQIRDVGHEILPEQLTAWQSEDMHRKFPNIEQPNYVSASTTIWPRSRTYGKTHRNSGVAFKKRRAMSPLPRLTGTFGGMRFGAHRPILRPELFKTLCERMEQMLAVNLKWVTSHTAGSQPPRTSIGPQAQRRLSMLQASSAAVPVAAKAQPGPRTLERWAKLKPTPTTKTGPPTSDIGVQRRRSKFLAEPPKPTGTRALPGPRARERMMRLGVKPPGGDTKT